MKSRIQRLLILVPATVAAFFAVAIVKINQENVRASSMLRRVGRHCDTITAAAAITLSFEGKQICRPSLNEKHVPAAAASLEGTFR